MCTMIPNKLQDKIPAKFDSCRQELPTSCKICFYMNDDSECENKGFTATAPESPQVDHMNAFELCTWHFTEFHGAQVLKTLQPVAHGTVTLMFIPIWVPVAYRNGDTGHEIVVIWAAAALAKMLKDLQMLGLIMFAND